MAKGLRSKVKQRWRSLRRQHLENIKVKQDVQAISEKLLAATQNRPYREKEVKNAFLYPEDPDAEFPQYKPPPVIDFRSSKIPQSGTQFIGAKRKMKNRDVVVVESKPIEEEEIQEEQDEQVSNDDDLVAQLEGFGLKSQTEKKKLRKVAGMQNELQFNATKKKIKKNRRKKQQLHNTKRQAR